MNKTTTARRCCECRRRLEPDPRVGARQVTCGAEKCQRERHSDRCRAWHRANGDVAGCHYEDVVVPFRRRQPDYQRRWRLAQRLREIREETRPLGSVLLTSFQALLSRTKTLSESPTSEAQTGVLTAKLLSKATDVLRGAVAALEQLEVSVAELRSMGL